MWRIEYVNRYAMPSSCKNESLALEFMEVRQLESNICLVFL